LFSVRNGYKKSLKIKGNYYTFLSWKFNINKK
jgi:hypothetical protein